jgi:DNA-binding transcriptional ArsR family regulator
MNSDILQIKKASLVFRAINHKLRSEIYDYLKQNGKTNVTKIYQDFQIEQSVASQHLAILRTHGFVKTERKERFILYCVNEERLNQVKEISQQLLKQANGN